MVAKQVHGLQAKYLEVRLSLVVPDFGTNEKNAWKWKKFAWNYATTT